MRQLLTPAVFLLALAGSRGDEKINAPVSKDPPSIDGKYNLLHVSTVAERRVPNAPGGVGGPGAGQGKGGGAKAGRGAEPPSSLPLLGPATITKNEITLEANARPWGDGPTTMEYTLDTTKSPMTIDVENTTVRGKKAKALGLVKVTGNHLIIALAKEGSERPQTTDEAEGVTVYYFKKSPPPPRTEYRIVAMTVGKEEETEKELNKLAAAGYELVSATQPVAADGKASPTTVHFIFKRTTKLP